MEVFFSTYTKTPIKRLNRTSSMDQKTGVYLRARLNGRITYADYFPHAAFGDRGVDQFLNEFKFQKFEYDRKIFHFLNHDHHYQQLPTKTFFNHQLWTGSEELQGPIVKYKLLRTNDDTFMEPLRRGHRVRLDANGLFNRDTLMNFIQSIPPEYLTQIEYVEDPLLQNDWSNLGIKTARDLIQGSPYDVRLYRPNCQFYPEDSQNVVFSSYLGSDLEKWHTYCELLEKGDLNQIHGIISRGFYAEERYFFGGNFETGFKADPEIVREIYHDLEHCEWKSLCSL